MNIEQILEIELNYLELAYIQGISPAYAKEIFSTKSQEEIIKRNTLIKVSVLKDVFKPIRSVDNRYDGENELIFNLKHKSENYKKYLSHKPTIKQGKLSGGKSVLLKIMNQNQLFHFKNVIEQKRIFFKSIDDETKN